MHAYTRPLCHPSQLTDVAPSAGSPEASKPRTSVNGTGQNIASHASPTAKNYFLLLSTFPLNPSPPPPCPSFCSATFVTSVRRVPTLASNSEVSSARRHKRLIIIIRNSYIAPNPTRLAQSTSQFKTRMDIRINT